MNKESVSKLTIVTIFAIAMGFLEAAVVIYTRELFYPNGFNFPLAGIFNSFILSVEWVREFATIVMLVAIGLLAGRKFYEKFAYFIYAFAVWDIFYYIFLKISLDWPASWFTWDLLFLIPWPWIGPVLAPVLCAILMIITALLIIHFEDSKRKVKINVKEWFLLFLGFFIVLYSWLYDYGLIIFAGGFAKEFFTLATNPQFNQIMMPYIPSSYNWILFLVGLIIASLGVIMFYLRTIKQKRK